MPMLPMMVWKGIIPAYAGSTCTLFLRSPNSWDHPRIRGEHDIVTATGCRPWGSSPHTRGAHQKRLRSHQRRRIIPAYAGSTGRAAAGIGTARDHPRIRGEHSQQAAIEATAPGSSPHTRGALPLTDFGGVVRGIIPAYAGSTGTLSLPGLSKTDHPRIRGEHPTDAQSEAFSAGSSPHTRGAPAARRRRHPQRRIIPAYAGSTPDRAGLCETGGIIPAYAGSTFLVIWVPPAKPDHPRIRGEHARPRITSRGTDGSSPHTRGAPPISHAELSADRIIPAYAGSTRRFSSPSFAMADHPRIRGEHSLPCGASTNGTGSSPHTRGAPKGSPTTRLAPTDHPRIRGEHGLP